MCVQKIIYGANSTFRMFNTHHEPLDCGLIKKFASGLTFSRDVNRTPTYRGQEQHKNRAATRKLGDEEHWPGRQGLHTLALKGKVT